MKTETRKYLAAIGSRGGKKSRRGLTPEQARRMVAVREARKAYHEYRSQCFWSYRSDARIRWEDVSWVVEGLMTEGNRQAFETARRIKRLTREIKPCQ